jgi:hypothetical protein
MEAGGSFLKGEQMDVCPSNLLKVSLLELPIVHVPRPKSKLHCKPA